ncbi:MAG: hypothetical protein OXT09_13740 [Myxococcales bacterium]|nr:hypothetical protein [Myxococcales bacterium]
MAELSEQHVRNPRADISEGALATARGRLTDRGIDPDPIVGTGELGGDVTVADFYTMLGMVAATEKAGQAPTHAMARLALHTDLPSEVADTLYLAYMQQSAEEAGHGDKVFGNAYFAMGGAAPGADSSAVGNPAQAFLAPGDDRKQNKVRLGGMAGLLGGIETVALNRVFPIFVAWCERWDHPIARDLLTQIQETVRPEESRHVLNWRYVFHTMIAPKGDAVIKAFYESTNRGRATLGSPPIDFETFTRMHGASAPTVRQLLGKERVAFN